MQTRVSHWKERLSTFASCSPKPENVGVYSSSGTQGSPTPPGAQPTAAEPAEIPETKRIIHCDRVIALPPVRNSITEPRTLVTLMDVNLGRQSRNTSIVAAFRSTGQSGNPLRKVEATTKHIARRRVPDIREMVKYPCPTSRCFSHCDDGD